MDRLQIKRGQIIGIPQIVDLLEESKASGIKSYILGLMQQPGVLLSSKSDGSWGDDLKVTEVNPTHIAIAAGKAVSATMTGDRYTDCNLIVVPDALETEHEAILLPGWVGEDPRYVYLEYTELYNESKNLTKWDENWVEDGKIYWAKSFIVHFEEARLLGTPWILLASIVRTPSHLVIEDLRGENVFKLKPTFMEPVVPPTPPIWLQTGWEKKFVGPEVQAAIVSPPAETKKAYVLVRWGDEGTGQSAEHAITDGSKTWAGDQFIGQWITVVELARRFKVTASGAQTLYFAESIPGGQSYQYVVGPHADEYDVLTEYVDDDNNRIPLVDHEGRKAFPRSDFTIQGAAAQGANIPNYRYIGGLTPGLRLQVEVIARNRLLSYKESRSGPAYIITGWGAAPVQPIALDAEFDIDQLSIHIGYDLNLLTDVSGFETYMRITDQEQQPYLDPGTGALLPEQLLRRDLVSSDMRTDFTTIASVPEAGAWIHLLTRAYDGAGQFSDFIYTSLFARIKKAPKPRGLLVATGITEEDEQDGGTIVVRKDKGIDDLTPRTAYIYCLWAEKSLDVVDHGGTHRIRVAKIMGPNKVRIEQVGYGQITPGVKWSDGAWDGYHITLIDRESNIVETRVVQSTSVTLEGFGNLTLDADLTLFTAGAAELDYILHPGATSYLVVLEPCSKNVPVDASDFSPTLYGRKGPEDILPLIPSAALQRIVDDRDSLIPVVPADPHGDAREQVVCSNQVYFQVPFGKKYRVKVAGMLGRDERTMSQFAISGEITAGVRIEPAYEGFECPMETATGPNYITVTFKPKPVTGAPFRVFQIVSNTGPDETVEASWDTDEVEEAPLRSSFKKTYGVGYGKWLRVRIRAILSKGGYTDEETIIRRSDKVIDVVDNIVTERTMGAPPVTE